MPGPRAAISHDMPELILHLANQTAGMVDTLVTTLWNIGDRRSQKMNIKIGMLIWSGCFSPEELAPRSAILARRSIAEDNDSPLGEAVAGNQQPQGDH